MLSGVNNLATAAYVVIAGAILIKMYLWKDLVAWWKCFWDWAHKGERERTERAMLNRMWELGADA